MIDVKRFVDCLDFFTGVLDSLLKHFYTYVTMDQDVKKISG